MPQEEALETQKNSGEVIDSQDMQMKEVVSRLAGFINVSNKPYLLLIADIDRLLKEYLRLSKEAQDP